MEKPNEIDKWAVELEPEPKQLWMVATGVEAKSFHIWFVVRVHNILVFMVVRRGAWGPWIGPLDFEI